uniref:Uncharacterized protein n=1 Tax=Onchocerca volvulus TaxID=6282 RepID=A0A8R1XTB9_ONCVO
MQDSCLSSMLIIEARKYDILAFYDRSWIFIKMYNRVQDQQKSRIKTSHII